jgi:penicillin-binding protein 1A
MRLFLILLILCPLTMAGAIYLLFLLWGDDLPSPQTLRELEPAVNTVVLDRNGEVIDEFYVENRNPLSLQEIPNLMRLAFLSTEDRRFFSHWGIDLQGIFRALLANVTSGRIQQGASTITQQLARKLFLRDEQTLERKLKEMVLAIRLERSFSKEEILELYLNKIYFGEGAYGVEAAAQTYFGKPCQNLDLPETALLAGLVANPGAFSPTRRPEQARRRRNLVLRRMEQAGVIDSLTAATAETTAVVLDVAGRSRSRAPYFTERVRQELAERYGTLDVFGGGLTVHTTLDMGLQAVAEKAVEEQAEKIEKTEVHAYKYLLDPNTRRGGLRSRVDSTPYLQGALVAIEPQTGAIRAMVGGRSFQESEFNRAWQALKQPGSAFKPIVFTQALLDGYRTNDILLDTPAVYEIPGPGNEITEYAPRNFDETFRGPVTLRYTLMKSINVPTVRLMDKIGPRRVVNLARSMGIDRNLPPYLSLALGSGEVTPLELTAAYAIFPDHGIREEPYLIERVEDRYGHVIDEHQSHSHEVIDERTSYVMVSMLRSVMDGGTGQLARSLYHFEAPAGGKTGTTDDCSDAWFVGFIPRLACGVWIGFDEKKSIGPRMTGAMAALPAWCEFMNAAVDVYGVEDFAVPPGITEVTTCQLSGQLALPGCPDKVRDAFLSGTQPTRFCPVHQGLPADGWLPPVEPPEPQ